MQYFTAYYGLPAAESTVSVLLKQVYHKRRKMPVVLACVSTEKDTYLTEGLPGTKWGKQLLCMLTDWFYGAALSLCTRRGERGMDAMADSLGKRLGEMFENHPELLTCQWVGALCVGERVLLFRRGEMCIKLLNTKNHRPYCQELKIWKKESSGLAVWSGTIQRGAGILLATKAFFSTIPAGKMEQCLNVREIRSQEQCERRLKEVGGCCEPEQTTEMAALLMIAG